MYTLNTHNIISKCGILSLFTKSRIMN